MQRYEKKSDWGNSFCLIAQKTGTGFHIRPRLIFYQGDV